MAHDTYPIENIPRREDRICVLDTVSGPRLIGRITPFFFGAVHIAKLIA